MIKIEIKANDQQQTILNFCKKTFKNETLGRIYHLFYNGKIRLNNKKINNTKIKINTGDIITIYDKTFFLEKKAEILPNSPLQIVPFYEDKEILIVCKDHGILTHDINNVSIDHAVRSYLLKNNNDLNSTFTISHLYRLDKMTKGLIIYPKSKIAQITLFKAQQNNQIKKTYYAVVSGDLNEKIKLNGFIYKNEIAQRMVFTVEKTGKNSKSSATVFTPIYKKNNFTLIECFLLTGRKHQIRASLSYLELPIVGDFKYGSQIKDLSKILLFAYSLEFLTLPEPLNYLSNKVFTLPKCKDKLVNMIDKQKFI